MLEYWIWLAHFSGITEQQKRLLLAYFGSPEAVYYAGDELREVEGIAEQTVEELQTKNLTEARKILDTCAKEEIRILTLEDKAYPSRLKNIYDPPLILYYKGNLPEFEEVPVIGIVGTRKPSAYGFGVARRLGFEVARCGGMVVSGLASGVDSAAMEGALNGGGKAVGVLGCGVDVIYPRSGRELFRQTEQFGCILSEFAPGTPPNRWNFPRRNRIISGMSNGVVVVEAPEKSGSLITAKLANDQGRDVFAVPGNVDMPGFVGSNQLLREGAAAVSCGWDILSEYQALYPEKIHKDGAKVPPRKAAAEETASDRKPGKAGSVPAASGKESKQSAPAPEKSIDKEQSAPYIDLDKSFASLSESEKAVLRAIGTGERLVDDVIAGAGIPAGKVLSTLTILELKRMVVRLPGRRIRLKK